MFDKSTITSEAQRAWSNAIEGGLRLSTSSVNYSGAKSLTLKSGMAALCPIPNPAKNQPEHFVRWNIELKYKDDSAHQFAETDRALFKGTFVLPEDCEGELKEFTMVGPNGSTYTVKGYALKPGVVARRRFPSLYHSVEGSVPFVAEDQPISLVEREGVRLIAYAKPAEGQAQGERFARQETTLTCEK